MIAIKSKFTELQIISAVTMTPIWQAARVWQAFPLNQIATSYTQNLYSKQGPNLLARRI